MQAIMLAAGVGARLSKNDENYLPKCLLQFDSKSLLARHIEILKTHGVEKLTLVIGYRAEDVRAELTAIGANDFVETVMNPDYRGSSMISLSCAGKSMRSGAEILFMDADVLYHPVLIEKLTTPSENSCIIYDTNFEPGDEPVKLCVKDGAIVEFSKNVEARYDTVGEWPGFVKWSPAAAEKIAGIIDRMIKEDLPYEAAFREYLLGLNNSSIICENIAGLPWIEIDFPEDLTRARDIILPAISS